MPSARSNLGNSELAETRNWKAAVLPKPALPITLKKGDIVGKTGGDLSVWKGKGHSERRPRDSHLFLSGQACSSRPHLPPPQATTPRVVSKCGCSGSRCSMWSRCCTALLTVVVMQGDVPGLLAQLHVCHCQLGQLHGQTRGRAWQVNSKCTKKPNTTKQQ